MPIDSINIRRILEKYYIFISMNLNILNEWVNSLKGENNLEEFILKDISQIKRNIVWYH